MASEIKLIYTPCCAGEGLYFETNALDLTPGAIQPTWFTAPGSYAIQEGGVTNCYLVDDITVGFGQAGPNGPPADAQVTALGSDCSVCCGATCYVIEPCDGSVPPFQISLSAEEMVMLTTGHVYAFNDPSNTLIDNGCYKVIEEVPCDASFPPLYIDVVIIKDYESSDCNICLPCYELTDCSDPTNTMYISWEPNVKPLDGGSDPKNSWPIDISVDFPPDPPVSPVNTSVWHYDDGTVANLSTSAVGDDCNDWRSIYRNAKDAALQGLDSGTPQDTVDLFTVEWSERCTKVVKWLIDDTKDYRTWIWIVQNDDNTLSFYTVQEDNFAIVRFTITRWDCCNESQINEWNEPDDLWPTLAMHATDQDVVLDSYWDATTGCMGRTNCDLTYIFDFNGACWTAVRQYEPCDGALTLGPTNIVDSYEDCDDCLVPCYKLIDCEDLYPTISTDNPIFQGYVGKVIFWQDVLGENHCATVEVYECKNETYPVEAIIVLDCYDTCIQCLPQPPAPEPIFQVSNRSATPGYNTPGCSPEYTEKVNCKFSEAVFQEMIAKRYGLDSCCDIDSEKYEIKKTLLDLAAIKEPYLCDPICAEFTYSLDLNIGDSAVTTFLNCDGTDGERIKPAVTVFTEHTVTVCALTTMVPVITIYRADTSIEQYKLVSTYAVCCPPVEIPCARYNIYMFPCACNYNMSYVDCFGEEVVLIAPVGESGKCFSFCAAAEAYPVITINDETQEGLIGDLYTMNTNPICEGDQWFDVPANPITEGCLTVTIALKEIGSGNIEVTGCDGEIQSTPYDVPSLPGIYKVCMQLGSAINLTGGQAYNLIEEPCGCGGEPVPVPVPVLWQSEACAIGFMDSIQFIEESGAAQVFNQSLDSLIIDGVEYVVPGNEPTWVENKVTPNGLSALTTVPANNNYGLTYLEQVDGMNAAFLTLGVDQLVKAQVVTNDYWAGTAIPVGYGTQGGFYLILGAGVSTISMELNDDAGYVRGYFRDALGVWTVANPNGQEQGVIPNGLLMYEFVTCTDTVLNEPFPVIDGVVIEATW